MSEPIDDVPWHKVLRTVAWAMFFNSWLKPEDWRGCVAAFWDIGWGIRYLVETVLWIIFRIVCIILFPISIPTLYYLAQYNRRYFAEQKKRARDNIHAWGPGHNQDEET